MRSQILVILTLAACSPAPVPVSSSLRDPSNPKAPEGVSPLSLTTPAAPQNAPAMDHAQHQGMDHSKHHGMDHSGHLMKDAGP